MLRDGLQRQRNKQLSLEDAYGDAVKQKAILEARVLELEQKLRDQLAEGGQVEDDRPRLLTQQASLYWTAFDRLLSSNGMGGASIDLRAVYEWADQKGEDRDLAEDVLFEMLKDYRAINEELNPPKK